MRRLSPAAPVLAFALALLAPAGADAAVPEFARTAEWVEVRTRHFTVITDAGAGAGRDVGRKLERFSLALGRLNPGLRAISPLPTTVFTFRDQREFESYLPAETENQISYFAPGEDRNLLVVNGSPEGMQRSEVIFGVFVHSYLSGNLPATPLWLSTGLSAYYRTCRLTRNAAEFGKPDMNIVDRMKGRAPITIGMMFAMEPQSAAYRLDNDLRDRFYAQSFALTHWLQSASGGRAERFDRFLARLHHGTQPMGAFREQFPSSEWDAMVMGLDEYLGRIDFEPTRRVELPPPSDADEGAVRDLAAAEALVRLGELVLHLGDSRHAEAAEHFEAALAIDPHFSPAQVSLGLVADLAGRADEAETRYARALAAAPNDASHWVIAARGTLQRLIKRVEARAQRETLQAIADLARGRFSRSLQIDPGDLEAMGGMGQTFAWLGEPADTTVVRRLERAVEALPGRADLAASLSMLKARQGRTAEAETLLARRVAPGSDPADLKTVQNVVRVADLNRAIELANQGRGTEAESLLAHVTATSPDLAVREDARRLLATMRDARSNNHLLSVIDEGVMLATEGRLEEARERFVEVRDRARDEDLKRHADRNVRQIDAEFRLQRAGELMRKNQLREAEATLSAADTLWPDNDYRSRAARALADLRGRREIERALGLVRAGKLAEARAAFARVVAMDVSEAMKDHARKNIKELDAAMRGR